MKLFVTSVKYLVTAALAAMLLAPGAAVAAPIVHLTDFIDNGTRTHFNDFETLPDTSTSGADLSPYSNGGITVTQAFTENDIWTTCTGGGACSAHQDERSWYPSGGDFGYTAITRTDGFDFVDMGLLVGSGYSSSVTFTYDLRLDNVQVLFGDFSGTLS